MTEPTLDLFGGPEHTLRRPRVAAGAMGLFALSYGLTLLSVVATTAIPYAAFSGIDRFALQAALRAAATVMMLAGLILLEVANVARDHVHPLPRRLVVLLGGLCHLALGAIWTMYLLAAPARRYSPYFMSDLTLPLSMIAVALASTAWLCALVYALQVANWLGDRRLAIFSAIALGLQFISVFGNAARMAMWYLGVGEVWENPVVQVTFHGLQLSAVVILISYFLVLMFRLAKKA